MIGCTSKTGYAAKNRLQLRCRLCSSSLLTLVEDLYI